MRIPVVLLVALLAGCASAAPREVDASDGNASTEVATPSVPASAPSDAPMGERAPPAMERFVLLPGGQLGVFNASAPELPATLVPEPLRSTAFYESFATPPTLTQWASEAFRSSWETTGDLEIRVSFTAGAPAAGANPGAAGFPPVGAILGAPERHAFFLFAIDAPQTLEADKVYTVTLRATPPRGGFFMREGEQLALHTFLSYQTADGTPVAYVTGGPDPAGLLLPHQHFTLRAPNATVLVDEAGELGPNPGITGDMQQEPVDIPFTVPPDALYVVLEIEGAAKAGPRVDLDVSARTPAGDVVGAGSGPGAKETVALGPGNLAAHGRELVAHVTNSANPSGATFTLKVTAYAP